MILGMVLHASIEGLLLILMITSTAVVCSMCCRTADVSESTANNGLGQKTTVILGKSTQPLVDRTFVRISLRN